jgi:hypothetical protein
MGRQRRGSGIMAKAWGTNHDSIIKPPFKARTMEQKRSSGTTKNLYKPFLRTVSTDASDAYWERYRARHK